MLIHRLIALFFLVIILMIFIGVPYLFLFGGADKFLKRPLRRRYEGLDLHETPEAGDVEVRYHTYRGLLLWFT